MRILALDVGSRRIGLAVSDPTGVMAREAGVIERTTEAGAVEAVRDAAVRLGAERIVVGLPLDMGGGRGRSAAAVEAFAERLRGAIRLPVTMWDERLTTAEAERLLSLGGLSRKRRRGRVDELAARIILQSYLDARAAGGAPEGQ